jgi:hypothetical protein
MRAWQLAAAFAGSRQALDALLRDDRLTQYLGGADRAEQLVGPGARRRLRALLPADLVAAVLSDTPIGLPPRSEAAERGWSMPTRAHPPPDPPAVLRRYLDQLSSEIATRSGEAGGKKPGYGARPSIALSWLGGIEARAAMVVLGAVVFVCVFPLAVAFRTVLSRMYPSAKPSIRRISDVATAIGGADGHLMGRTSGAGVFGEGPYWSDITTLRTGPASDVAAALLECAVGAGYQRDEAEIHGWGFSFPRSAAMPELSVKVVGEGQLFVQYHTLGYPRHLVRGRRGSSPVLVRQMSGGLLGPGTADTDGIGSPLRKFRYSLIVPPFVPVGSCAAVVLLNEPR